MPPRIVSVFIDLKDENLLVEIIFKPKYSTYAHIISPRSHGSTNSKQIAYIYSYQSDFSFQCSLFSTGPGNSPMFVS